MIIPDVCITGYEERSSVNKTKEKVCLHVLLRKGGHLPLRDVGPCLVFLLLLTPLIFCVETETQIDLHASLHSVTMTLFIHFLGLVLILG